MHPDDDTPPHRPRWLAVALIVAVVVVVAGMLTVGLLTLQADRGAPQVLKDTDTQVALATQAKPPPQTDAALAAGKAAVSSANCLRCHGVDRTYVGPAFNQVSARYAQRPDAVDYLAGKIRNGGSGEWGRALMPRHPQLSEEQARQMAQWVMSLPAAVQAP